METTARCATAMIRANIPGLTPAPASAWRRISLGSWRPKGDSSIHAELDLDVSALEEWSRSRGARLFPVLCRAIALAIRTNPEFNRIVRFGRIYQRPSVDLFVLSSTHAHEEDDDLSGFLIRQADNGCIDTFLKRFDDGREQLKSRSSELQRFQGLFRFLPGALSRLALNCLSFSLYVLNVRPPLPGLPGDAFGSAQITNVGSLGIDLSFSPIAPYTHIPLVISAGAIRDTVGVEGLQTCVRRRMRMGFVVDHRVADGKHIGRLFRDIRAFAANPESIDRC